jgi:hypothetical protein
VVLESRFVVAGGDVQPHKRRIADPKLASVSSRILRRVSDVAALGSSIFRPMP